jgi:hypothetical protein
MAILLDQLTLGEVAIISLDSDPRTGGGFAAAIGSFATINNSGAPVGQLYVKSAAGNTAWELVSTTASAGTIAAGTAGNLSLYPASSNGVSDTYVQNSQNIKLGIVAQPTRSAAIQYTIPNPGDAITAASFVLSEGTQTINGAKTFTSPIAMSAQKITGLADPTAAQDAATKFYVDAVAQGLSWKNAVRAATTTNGTLATSFANGQVIDGITLATNDRILLKNQTTQTQNGIYIVQASGAPVRSVDMDASSEFVGTAVFVDEGTLNADTAWVQITAAPITVGSSNIVFVQFAGAGTYTAGNGLTLSGTQFSVNLATASGLTFSSGALDHLLDGTTLSKSASGLRVALLGITNTEVATAAAIARTKLASGSVNHVLINDGSGVMSSEAQLALTRGGTNASLTAVAGGVVYSGASALAISVAGTTGQALISGGTGAPTWFTATGVVKASSGVLSVSNVSLTTEVSGILPVANGGTNSSTALSNNRIMVSSAGAIVENAALTSGHVIYANASGLPAGSANHFWDNTNSRLGIGTNVPSQPLHVVGNVLFGTGSAFLHQAVSGITWREQQATVATTDATVTTLDTFTVPTDTTVLVEYRIAGRRTGGVSGTAGDSYTYVRTARVSNIAGTLSIFNLQSDFTSESIAGANATLDVTGTTIRCRVTGAATTNISWFSHAKILNV